jgi:hypothetical protein
MDEHDASLLAQYGIKTETKVLFHFDGHRYERLADAVSYARLLQTKSEEGSASIAPGHEN